jgi:hypothetical protein
MRNRKKRENAASGLLQPAAIRSFQKIPTGRGFAPWLAEMSRRRGFVEWLADYVHLSPRQLANIAKKLVVPRAENGYNRDWSKALDDLAAVIQDRKRFRKGNRRRQARRKKKPVTELDRLEGAMRQVNTLLGTDAVRTQIHKAPESRLRRLELLALRIDGLFGMIERARHSPII